MTARARSDSSGGGSRQGTSRGFPPARRRFGQHFLEPAWAARLIECIHPSADDTFLEVGPGRGALTAALARQSRRVVAVELDRDLARMLRSALPANVHLLEGDFLNLDFSALIRDEPTPLRVVGNLPYNVASPILFRLLKESGGGRILSDAMLMLQREVANRLLAQPASSDYGALTIQVGLLAETEKVLALPPGAFRPPPKVHSTVVRVRFHPPLVDTGSQAAFDRIVRGLFLQRRKTLLNALRPVARSLGREAAELIERAGVDGRRRPETLSLAEMARLSRAVL